MARAFNHVKLQNQLSAIADDTAMLTHILQTGRLEVFLATTLPGPS